ncbi:MAG: hypothetical protein M5U34_27275 [Chloroflexi bacterium]|nr:hypothetical protein [Chloroflexota bacterium]
MLALPQEERQGSVRAPSFRRQIASKMLALPQESVKEASRERRLQTANSQQDAGAPTRERQGSVKGAPSSRRQIASKMLALPQESVKEASRSAVFQTANSQHLAGAPTRE